MKRILIAATLVAAMAVSQAHAQTKTLKEMIVGTWIFGVAEVVGA